MTFGRVVRVLLGGAGAAGLGLGVFGLAGAGAQDAGCASYSSYSALASAAGQRTSQAAPGLLPVNEADNGLPSSQAEFDSRSGSTAQAGAPYSDLVAGNIGLTGVNANDVPVFAVSKHPTDPKVEKSSPTFTLKAETAADSARASTEGGPPASEQSSAGRVVTTAVARCGDGGSVEAIADNQVDMFDVAGVLRLGVVRSHARAVVDAAGKRTFEATMEVDGATVLEQRVAITDKGVVTGSSASPLPDDDALAKALVDAGITIRYIAAAQNAEQGEVLAPGLEIAVTRRAEGVGTGPAVTTITLGRAYARAARSSEGVTADVPTDVALSTPDLDSGVPFAAAPVGGLDPLPSPALPSAGGRSPSQPQPQLAPALTTRIANWSMARAYTALAVGVLLMTVSRLGIRSSGASLFRLDTFKARAR
jgi:hypothetical protein